MAYSIWPLKNKLITYEKDFAIIAIVFISGFSLLAWATPPAEENSGGRPVGVGGATSSSGLILLISLAAGYGRKKVYDFRKSKLV